MDIILEFAKRHDIPIAVISTLLLMWGMSAWVFPHLPKIKAFFTFANAKDKQIEMLKKQIEELQEQLNGCIISQEKVLRSCDELKGMLQKKENKENRIIGYFKALNMHLKPMGIDLKEDLDNLLAD